MIPTFENNKTNEKESMRILLSIINLHICSYIVGKRWALRKMAE